MIQGEVTPDKQAMILLQIYHASGQPEARSAQIDTGFSGFLTLSPAQIVALQLTEWGRASFILGDGHDEEFNLYSATVLFNGQERDIFVLETDADPPLVGMSLLYGFRLHMDVVDGGEIIIDDIS